MKKYLRLPALVYYSLQNTKRDKEVRVYSVLIGVSCL